MKIIKTYINKYREQILYLFFGGLTFLVSVGSYALFNTVFGINELISNVFSWILAVLFAYLTNRKWVFNSNASTKKEIVVEMVAFFGGRVITLLIEEAILFVFITLLHFNSLVVKIAAQVVVVILNYVISKLIVFRKKGSNNG